MTINYNVSHPIRPNSMRCPKCEYIQLGGTLECIKCGAIFANVPEPPTGPIQIEEMPTFTSQLIPHWGKIAVAIAVLLASIGVVNLRRELSRNAPGMHQSQRVFLQKVQKSETGEACMKSAIESGNSELEARANCYNDSAAWAALESGSKGKNDKDSVSADDVSRAEVQVIIDRHFPTATEVTGEIYLQLFDEDDNAVSAVGKVGLSCSNIDVCQIATVTQQTDPNKFQMLALDDGDAELMYPLGKLKISREHLRPDQTIKVRAEFNATTIGSVELEIEPIAPE